MDIKHFLTRTSVREYVQEPLTQEEKDNLFNAINNSPTSTNAQNFSAIFIEDQLTKNLISKANHGQLHIATAPGILVFIGDRTRNNHFLPNGIENADIRMQEYTRAMVDASIASTYAMDALASMGFGTAYIGGLTGFSEELKTKLNLPKNSFIVTGICFGKPASINSFKAKVNKVYVGKYNEEQAIKEIEKYNQDIIDYYASRGKQRDFATQVLGEADPSTPLGKGFVKSGKYARKIIEKISE